MQFQQTTATNRIIGLTKKIRAICGGTSASKTISTLLFLIAKAQTDKTPTLTSVISESTPHLKRGAIRDFKNIMQGHNYWKDARWNATDFIYTFETGSKLEFFSADQSSKLRGARRDRAFINEANNVSLDAFDQVEVRTKEFIILDWNPTNEFWFYSDVHGMRTDVDFITLTYKDNEALSKEIVDSIEARKNRKGWWQVYGLGLLGEVEGKIYRDWKIIDEIPHEARLERYGLDFGYSCLKGDTMIETSKGSKRIDKIKVGEEVLTRNGYKKVIRAIDKGIKDVYDVDFGLGKSIVMTGDHRVFTKDGWKESSKLLPNETICVLQKNLMVESTEDTQRESTQCISITTQEKRIEYYIETFTKRAMELSQKVWLFIMLMVMHLIMIFQTLCALLFQNIQRFMLIYLNGTNQKKAKNKEKRSLILKKTGKKEEENLCKQQLSELKNVQNVGRKSHQQMYTKSFAELYVERKQILETQKKSMYARIAVKSLLHHPTIKETHALKSVPIFLQPLKEKEHVYDLTIEDEHEFFANGVLVHNCDPTSIIALYYYNGGFIIDEIAHKKGLSNKQIADILLNQETSTLVIADSAEPKSIDEIRSYGVNILGASKGKDSVRQGIQFVQDQKISVTKRSVNVIKAYRNYLWKTDKDGNILNEPDHYLSDAMDSVRYSFNNYKNAKKKNSDVMKKYYRKRKVMSL